MIVVRGMTVLINQEKYQENLLERIVQIKTDSDHLFREAQVSDMVGSKQALTDILRGIHFHC